MPVRKPALFTLATLALAISAPAFAKTIYSSGDWALDDSQPEIQGKGNCVAATATYLGNYGAYSLNIILDKSGTHPIELMIRPFKSPSKAVSFKASPDAESIYTFVKLPKTAKSEDTFWNLPRSTAKFIAQLKNSNQLTVEASDGMGQLPFSLNGAAAVLTKLEKLCVASPAMNSADFEKAFLPGEVNNVDFSALDQAKSAAIRDIIIKGAAAYRNIDKLKAELTAMEARYVKLAQEKASLPTEIDQLTNRDIPSFTAGRAAAQTNIDKANGEMVSLKAAIKDQESILAAAQSNVASAKENIKSIMPEHQRLNGLKQKDEQRVAAAEAQQASSDQAYAAKGKELSDRVSEAETLGARIAVSEGEIRSARVRVADAQKALSAFDPAAEIRRRRDSDRRIIALEKEIRALSQNNSTGEQASALAAKTAERDGLVLKIEQDINAQREEIAGREAEARIFLADSEKRRDEMNTRARDLNQYVIPSLREAQLPLQAQREAAAKELGVAHAALTTSTETLRRYDASVKFAALDAEIQKAGAKAASIQDEIARLKTLVTGREQFIAEQTALRESLTAKIAAAKESINKKNLRIGEVNKALPLHDADRKAADENIEAAKKALADISSELAAQLPQAARL